MKRFLALLLVLALNADPVLRAAAAGGQIAGVQVQAGQVVLPAFGIVSQAPAGTGSGSIGTFVSLTPSLPGVESAHVQTRTGVSAILPEAVLPSAAGAAAPHAASVTPAAPALSAAARKAPLGQASEAGALPSLLHTVRAGVLPQDRSQGPDVRTVTTGMSRLFDGTRSQAGTDSLQEPSPVPAASAGTRISKWLLFRARLGLLRPQKTEVRTGFSPDEYGGPPALQPAAPRPEGRLGRLFSTLKEKGGYGLRWGLNMVGIAALLDTVVRPALQAVPWPLFTPGSMLESLGRTELLTRMGAAGITQALAESPLQFLLLSVPKMVLFEELGYRLLAFGLTFVGLATLRPLSQRASALLEEVPDLFGIRSGAQKGLRAVSGVSGKAYVLAATLGAYLFAAAHFAAWGAHPYTLVFHAVMALALTHAAYRSRSLTAPFVAHLAFNLITIATGFLLPMHVVPLAAAGISVAVSLAGLGFLVKNYLSYRRPAAPTGGWRRWLTVGLVLSTLAGAMTAVLPGGMLAPDAGQPRIALVEERGTLTNPAAPVLTTPMSLPAAASAAKPALSTEQIVRSVKPAVVMIMTAQGSIGSGFIVRADGLLVTNAHVVEGVAVNGIVMIRFANGLQGPGMVVGFNAEKDLALIQLPANPAGWPTVTLGDSGTLSEGEEILAIGYPLGLPFSVSRGIVSGLGLRNNGYVSYVQHDASVNPGNSGGPLFNQRGEVVGVNTQIMTQGGGFDGIAYSISSADVQKAIAQYDALGTIANPWMGAVFYPADPALSAGPRVEAVRAGSPAARAGLRAGDTVVAVDGLPLPGTPEENFAILQGILRAGAPAGTVTLQVQRGAATAAVTITLGAR